MARLYFAGENDKAIALQERLLPLIDAMFTEVNPIPVKTAASLTVSARRTFVRL